MSAPILYFDVWSGDDAKGAALGELSKAYAKSIHDEFNNLGSGALTINRHDAQAVWAVPGNLVRARLEDGGPFDWDDPRYVFAFWIDEGSDVVVSTDEEGGETYTRSGQGIMSYMGRAAVYHRKFAGGSGKVVPKDGYWQWASGQPEGVVMNRLMNEVRARWSNQFYAVDDFGDTHDSDGGLFDTFDALYRVNIGISYLDVIAALRELGLQFGMDPDFSFHCWQSHGQDLTADVVFALGVNIRESSERAIHGSPYKSRVLVRGKTKADKVTYREVRADPPVEAPSTAGRRREGYTEYTKSASNATLDKVGHKFLRSLLLQKNGPQTIGVTIGDGSEFDAGHYLPWTDYRPGDTVAVDVPGEYEAVPAQIISITVSDSEGGDAEVALEFEATSFDPQPGLDPNAGIGPGGCDDCPDHRVPFVPDVPPFVFIQSAKTADGAVPFPTATFDNPPVAGHTLFAILDADQPGAAVTDWFPGFPPGWIVDADYLPGELGRWIAHKVSDGTEQTVACDIVGDVTANRQGFLIIEEYDTSGEGVDVAQVHIYPLADVALAQTDLAAMTPTPGSSFLILWSVRFRPNYAPTVSSGWNLRESWDSTGGSRFRMLLVDRVGQNAAGAFAGTLTSPGGTDSDGWLLSVVVYELDAGAPVMGQPSTEELVGYGDGTTVLYTTNYSYAPGSIRFREGAGRMTITETDPVAGTFTLSEAVPLTDPPTPLIVGYLAAENAVATGAGNLPPIPGEGGIPYPLLGSGGDGSGANLLHDDGTWGSPASGTRIMVPLTTVVAGEPQLVWDDDDELVLTEIDHP